MSEAREIPAAQAELMGCLEVFLPRIDAIDPAEGRMAAAVLNEQLPFDGPEVSRVRELAAQGLDEGWLTPRAAGDKVKFGRLAKDLGGYAIDAVLMDNAAGMGHTHTRGEINMCFAWEGEPKFDGMDPGWVVFEPESHHIPTVTGGTMLFIYFTPGGAVVWDT